MDFFTAQDRARRKTWQLIVLFAIAVVGLIVTTNVLVAVVAAYSTTTGAVMGPGGALQSQSAGTWVLISGIVIIVIAGASLVKYLALRSGGRAIVEMLGGRQIDPGTQLPAERRLLNVVEEMAIAAGIPVPAVYIVDEAGINAFAAGFNTDDAVIGVTAGTLEYLNRDELQGVIGHEFSHVLNGDSRINLRLIAILNGIVFIGLIGRLLLRNTGGSRRNSSAMPILVMGLGLVVIGYAGTFCANLIKAAVSRQREFLADAASVQFTRNPDGIANALKKIGGAPQGSTLVNAHAAEMSHMFFGQALRIFLGGMMATHPPLQQRIRAIEPGWDGEFMTGAPDAQITAQVPDTAMAFTGASTTPAQTVSATVGNPTATSLVQAQTLLGGLPERAVAAARDAWSARALVYALLLAPEVSLRDRQYAAVARANPSEVMNSLDELQHATQSLDALQRLTLISLALPALKSLSQPQYVAFVTDTIALIRVDQHIDLFEWVLHRVLLKALKPHFEGPTHSAVSYSDLRAVAPQVAEVLSAIASADTPDADARRRAFMAGTAAAELELAFVTGLDPNFTRLNEALRQLRLLSPLAKPRLLKACAACALIDGASVIQRALLIGIAATLDCPLPPDLAFDF